MYLSAFAKGERAPRRRQDNLESAPTSIPSTSTPHARDTPPKRVNPDRERDALHDVSAPPSSAAMMTLASSVSAQAPRRRVAAVRGNGAGLTGQDDRFRSDAAIPLEMVGLVASPRGTEPTQHLLQGEQRRASQPITGPLADPKEARRRRILHEARRTSGSGGTALLSTAVNAVSDELSRSAFSSGEDEDDDDDEAADAEAQDLDDEAVATGTVISPNTVVCALATSSALELVRGLRQRRPDETRVSAATPSSSLSAPSFRLPAVRAGLVLTAECGGWLRVRESRDGTVRHQQQLRGGHEVSACAWLVTSGGAHRRACRLWAVCGVLGGQLCFYEAAKDSLKAWPRLAPLPVHHEPVVAIAPMYSVAPSAASTKAYAHMALHSFFLSMDAGGQIVLWHLSEDSETARGGTGGGEEGAGPHRRPHRQRRPHLTCLQYASTVDRSDLDLPDANGKCAEGPPVLASAASLCSSGFLLTQPLAAGDDTRASAQTATNTTVYLYTCDLSRAAGSPPTHNDADDEEEEEEGCGDEGAGRRLWFAASRRYVGVDRARDGAVTALCAVPDTSASAPLSPSGLPPAIAPGQVWAGTSGGVACVWEASTGFFLRRITMPCASPIHALSCASSDLSGAGAPLEVWVCQLDGSVTAWHTRSFQMNQSLPLSYPPLHQRTTATTAGQLEPTTAAGAGTAPVRVRDATDLAWALYGDPSLAPVSTKGRTASSVAGAHGARRWSEWQRGARCHFTLALTGLEAVRLRRAWTIATDGTVRTWLVPAGAAPRVAVCDQNEARSSSCKDVSGGDSEHVETTTTASPQAPLDHSEVRAFLFAAAESLTSMQADYEAQLAAQAEHITRLETRNRILAEALKRAADTGMEKLNASIATSSSLTVTQDGKQDEEKSDCQVDAPQQSLPLTTARTDEKVPAEEVTTPAEDAPANLTSPAARADMMAALLQDLRARLDESLATEAYLQRRLTASELLSLEERTRGQSGSMVDTHNPHTLAAATTTPPRLQPSLLDDSGDAVSDERAAALGVGTVHRLASPAIRQSARHRIPMPHSTPDRTAYLAQDTSTAGGGGGRSPSASPIAPFRFYPSPVFDRRGGVAADSDDQTDRSEEGQHGGRAAVPSRANRLIHSPILLSSWTSKARERERTGQAINAPR